MKPRRKPLDHSRKIAAPIRIHINRERCKGCGYCVEFCPKKVLYMSPEIGPKGYNAAMVSDESRCPGCGFCEAICPEFAIKISTDNNAAAADTKDSIKATKR